MAVIVLVLAVLGVFVTYGGESSPNGNNVLPATSPRTSDGSSSEGKTPGLGYANSKGDVVPHTIPGGLGGYGQPAYFVINDQSTLAKVWTQAFCTNQRIIDPTNPAACIPQVPERNFTENTIIAVFLGEKPTGGYSIRITDVDSRGSHLVVSVLITVPGPYCFVTQMFTSPYDMIWIPKTDQKVIFTTQTHLTNCAI